MPCTSHNESYPFSPRLSRELSGSSFDAQTSELLHHYITNLSTSLARNRAPSVWRVSMPQMGLAHPFLLSGIIAISALHLATLHPHRKHELQNLAVAQESAALPSFRASVNNPSAETIHATFAFAGSVVYYIMASPEVLHAGRKVDRCRIPSREDEYPHWFQTMRGLMALLANHWDELAKGPFAPLLSGDARSNHASDSPDDEHLAKLEGMFPSPSFSQDSRKVEICKEALKELRRVVALTHSPNRILSGEASLRVWPGNISQDFLELIYERDPRALVILAHYCVLLKKNDHVWYLRGLGRGLLENIRQALGEEWRPWIQWPIEHHIC
jgi:hypothetical protein